MPPSAPILPVPRWRQPDPEWDAAVAAAAALAEAEDAAERDRTGRPAPSRSGQEPAS